jgi:hypothetical protein
MCLSQPMKHMDAKSASGVIDEEKLGQMRTGWDTERGTSKGRIRGSGSEMTAFPGERTGGCALQVRRQTSLYAVVGASHQVPTEKWGSTGLLPSSFWRCGAHHWGTGMRVEFPTRLPA